MILIGLPSGTAGNGPVMPLPARCNVVKFDAKIHEGMEPWKGCLDLLHDDFDPSPDPTPAPSRIRLFKLEEQELTGRVPEIQLLDST